MHLYKKADVFPQVFKEKRYLNFKNNYVSVYFVHHLRCRTSHCWI